MPAARHAQNAHRLHARCHLQIPPELFVREEPRAYAGDRRILYVLAAAVPAAALPLPRLGERSLRHCPEAIFGLPVDRRYPRKSNFLTPGGFGRIRAR